WSDLGTGATRTDLAAGVYFVTFTDAAEPDCEGVVEVIIGINSILEVEIEVIVSPTCGNADGEIAANVTNGSGNYQYTWSFGGSNMTESALESDSYAVTVTDIDNPNCTASASIVLIDGDVANIDVIINGVTDITCLGANDGFVDFTANVPAGFNVIITDGINIYENGSLPVGELCIEITDASDCVAGGICFEIEEPTELDVEFSISGGCAEDGAINIITNGGTGNYTFDWLDLPGDDNIEDRTNLSTGIYSVIVSDENECAVVGLDLAIECEECEDPIIDYTIAFESVCGGFIGSAEVVVNGNITDYTYDWTPAAVGTVSADGNKLTQLPAGLYQVVVADIGNLACIDSVSILVTNEDGPEATIELVTPAGCDDSDGTATLAPDSLTYEWSDGGVGAIRDDLAAGIYEVIYYDDEDTICYNVLLVEISDTSNLELEVEIISLPDCNMNNGEVMINLLSVMGELVFIWSDGGSGQNRDDLEAGTYTVIALEEASGCSTEITFTLLNNVAETATINITEIINISCNGDGLGSIIFDVTYDAAFVQPAVVTVTDGFTAYDPNNLPVGNYCINVEDANKCLVASECFEITETEELVLSIVGTYAGCEGSDELGSFDVTVTGGTMPYSFDWADLTDPNEPEDRTDLSAGIYDLTVTDALGCMIIANNIGLDTFCITDCEYFNGIDTLNMEITCGDTLEVCTDLSYGDFLLGEYSISLDGVLYDATTEDVCEADLFYFYPLTSLSPGNGLIGPYVAEWDIDGNIINIGEFLTLSDLVDSMNVLDLGGNWILDQSLAGSAVGGNTGAIYGNLTITVANNPSDSNTIIVGTLQNALNISIGIAGEGQHEVIIINNETLCPDTLIVNLACKGYVLYDTMTLGDSIYYCLDIVELIDSTDLMGNIVSLENVCPDESGTSVIFNIESEVPPCISYLGITPGTDTACLVLCDDLGICDTVNYIVTVIPTGPIIVTDTVLVMEQDTFCLDSLTNLCGDIVSVTDFCNDGGMIVDFDIIQTDDDFCITYEGLNIGVDSACLEVIDIYGNADTVIIIITVATTTPDTICDTIFIGQIVEYCIDASELLTAPETLINICEDQSGEFVEFFADENTYCVTYEGVADVGTDSACIVICDSVGVCDTTYFCITVVEFFDPPIAVDDYDTTLTNIPIVINVKENDTIFGGIDSIYVIDGPLVGDVILNLDCTFTYTPDEGVCSITDSFTYVVCNPNACDTATVFIYIQCTDLTIFNGFSPNNDGVNDVFYIDGIEDFPNNRLCVYNRWGNKVYDKKGYNNEWFGTWTGNDLPDGTYFYVLDLGAENEGKPTIYNGYIQIHR
ncbi:MAG: gliding motility-associated-like protein, partial [Maribacter sp.]